MLSYSWKMKTKPVNQKYSLVKKTDGDVLGSSVFFFFFSLSVFRFLLPAKDEAHCNNKKPFINSTTFWGNNNRKLGCFFRVPLVANEQSQGVSIP